MYNACKYCILSIKRIVMLNYYLSHIPQSHIKWWRSSKRNLTHHCKVQLSCHLRKTYSKRYCFATQNIIRLRHMHLKQTDVKRKNIFSIYMHSFPFSSPNCPSFSCLANSGIANTKVLLKIKSVGGGGLLAKLFWKSFGCYPFFTLLIHWSWEPITAIGTNKQPKKLISVVFFIKVAENRFFCRENTEQTVVIF